MNSITNLIREVVSRARQATQSLYFGFFQGHTYLTPNELHQLSQLVGITDDTVVADFERQFAQLIGTGEAIAYAAARMGFYEIMRLQGITKEDEVILLGATCAVMVNAVMRTGATPIYADIDPDTFGSSSQAIAACITPRTRIIVAQHSFGIPCDIEPIVSLAKEKEIFLIEDCALTLGSKANGIAVGNFGDAALFSTDHSKPLSTLTGGLIYTKNTELANRLRSAQVNCPHLSIKRQNKLWQRLLLEARYCVPARLGRLGLIDLFFSITKKITHAEGDFLADDFGTTIQSTYPYPAKLPAFLAAIGLIEVKRWTKTSLERANTLKRLIEIINQSSSRCYLPAAYKNKKLEIIPLRFAWSEPKGAEIRLRIKSFIHVSWTLFMTPIIATKSPLQNLGYEKGSCPISESIGPRMVNIPCIFNTRDSDILISKLILSII
ncbi:MAG: DegT/DnrJ/EryC1/StrS family aminotransferase [Thiothrix sp.]|nr:DegT/DnrJ/EryC1/StrS family aminotransferase [Thiothrix sp.]